MAWSNDSETPYAGPAGSGSSADCFPAYDAASIAADGTTYAIVMAVVLCLCWIGCGAIGLWEAKGFFANLNKEEASSSNAYTDNGDVLKCACLYR